MPNTVADPVTASVSQFDPGNTTTAARMLHPPLKEIVGLYRPNVVSPFDKVCLSGYEDNYSVFSATPYPQPAPTNPGQAFVQPEISPLAYPPPLACLSDHGKPYGKSYGKPKRQRT
jgi:hypothetical protein